MSIATWAELMIVICCPKTDTEDISPRIPIRSGTGVKRRSSTISLPPGRKLDPFPSANVSEALKSTHVEYQYFSEGISSIFPRIGRRLGPGGGGAVERRVASLTTRSVTQAARASCTEVRNMAGLGRIRPSMRLLCESVQQPRYEESSVKMSPL